MHGANLTIPFPAAALAAMLALPGLPAAAQEVATQASDAQAAGREVLIREALSAAPPQVARTATVMDLQGNVLREGVGGFTCFPSPPDFAGPMCFDAPFLSWMQALMAEEVPEVSTVGFAYMLAGDSPTGGASNVDPAARTPTADNQWVVEGPHVMLIVPDEALLAGLPTTPDREGPYVMWPGTPFAHVMWPVAERGEQRATDLAAAQQ